MDVIILAGGKGSRLAPWPAPKCLLPINGVPILIRLLDHLLVASSAHVRRAIICTGYRAYDVGMAIARSVYGTPEHDGTILFSDAGEDASMGTRLLKAREQVKSDRVLIVYGDELADVDVGELLKFHCGRPDNQMSFAYTKQRVPGGVIESNGVDGVAFLDEKHTVDVNIGFVVAEQKCWNSLVGVVGLSDWINQQDAGAYYHSGKRATVNSLADLQYAEEIWK